MNGVKTKVRDMVRRFHSGGESDDAVRMFGRRRMGLWKRVSGSQLDNPAVWLQVANGVWARLGRDLDILGFRR